MLKNVLIFVVVFSFVFTLTLSAEEVFCVKKKLNVNDRGKAQIRRSTFVVREDSCRRNEHKITLPEKTAADLLSSISSVDGANSGLDADTLDGIQASGFVLDSELSAVSQSVTSLNSELDGVEGRVTAAETSITSLQGTASSNSNNISTNTNDISNLKNGPRIIRVGTSDAQYTTIADAITYLNGRTRNSSNRWIIQLGMGNHTLSGSTTVPTYTTINGMGKNLTFITGSTTSSNGLLFMGFATAISNLTVENTASTSSPRTIYYNTGASSNIEDMARIEQRIDNVRVITRNSGVYNYGIYVIDSDLVISNVEVSVGNGTSSNRGILTSDDGNVFIINTSIYVADNDGNCSSLCFGLMNYNDTAKVELINTNLVSSDNGLYGYGSSTTRIASSYIRATGIGLSFNGASNASIHNSTVKNISGVTTGTRLCAGVYS